MQRTHWVVLAVFGVAGFAVGCAPAKDYKPVAEVKKATPVPGHDHGEKGPHGGAIVELGDEEYHAELVVDHATHALIVYVLGKDAKTADPIAATEVTVTPAGKTALTLKASPQKDDPEGKSSKFELINEEAVDGLLGEHAIHGDLDVKVGEKSYKGEIDYHLDGSAHTDHDEAAEGKK